MLIVNSIIDAVDAIRTYLTTMYSKLVNCLGTAGV